MRSPLPDLSDRNKVLAVAVGATAATAALAVVLHRRRTSQWQGQAAAAATPVAAAPTEPAVPAPEPAEPLPQPVVAVCASLRQPGTSICTLPQLLELQQCSGNLELLSSAPTSSVCVTGQGASVAFISPAVCTLRQLRELDLSGNAIVTVPTAIGSLTALTRLKLASNAITDLPPQIGQLQALEDLDVSCNHLSSLPDELGCLSHLKYLNAMSNHLPTLPDSIGGCTALLRLGLKNNRLVSLPASIGQLGSLVELYLTDNMLESLPAEMGNMRALVKLQASFNPLKSLPAQLGALPNLEMLRVASCAIEEIPAELQEAPKLAWMSLASNPACRVLSPHKPPCVELSELAMGRKLGDGASGEVFEAQWKGQRVAVKIFVADRSPDGHSRDEMAVAFSVDEKHLVRVLGQLEQPLGLILEFAEGSPIAEKPNLQSLLRCRWAVGETFQLAWVLKVAISIAGALEHMHYRGICHGDVYAHNVMADESGHATLCDYGASFPYHKHGHVKFEAQEVRAFGLMLADMVQRMDIDFQGMEELLGCQRELFAVVQLCTSASPLQRPTFGAVGRQLRTIQKHAAGGGIGEVTYRSDTCMFTPRPA